MRRLLLLALALLAPARGSAQGTLFIVGGGVSKEHEAFLPLLKLHTPIVPAELRNNAGIMGAASLAADPSGFTTGSR